MNLRFTKFCFYLITISSISFLFSCKNNIVSDSQKKVPVIHFNLSNWERNQKIPNKIIKNLVFVPLETNLDCMLGEIDKIVSVRNLLFIMDRGINKKIFMFTIEGKYLGSIGKYGKGPGELISITDFAIDNINNQLLILDAQLRKILTYNLQDATFLSEIKIDFIATDFVKLDNNVISFYTKFPMTKSGKNYLVANMNLKDKKIKWFLEQDEFDTMLSSPHSIFQSGGTYFSSYFGDIIYQITQNKVEPYITFDFGQNKIPKERLKNIHSSLKQIVDLLKEKEWTYGIENVFENDQFLTFNLKLKQLNTMVIYSKSTGNYFYGNQYEGEIAPFRIIKNLAVNNNKFLGSIDAFNFKRLRPTIRGQGGIEDFEKQYLQTLLALSDQSNPIIILIEYNIF